MKIGIIGNGNVARRLAALMQHAGHDVLTSGRGEHADTRFLDAASHGELVVLAVPFTALAEVLADIKSKLAGKIVVDATNPLNDDWSPLALEGGLSAGECVQQWLPEAQVVKAFNTIFADAMLRRSSNSGEPVTTAFLCGEEASAKATLSDLITGMGFEPLDAGPLRCARYLEAMAHLNIQLAVGMGGGTQAIFNYHRPTDFSVTP